MAKLIMLSGLPASGKTTRAREIVDQGNWVRVNKDLIREMLHFNKFTGRNEGLTIKAEKAVASHMLLNNINVVVDDTNLGQRHKDMWKAVVEACGASEFVHEHMDVAPDECVVRDTGRENPVGKDVIYGMALQYNLLPKPERGYIVCDLDGSLCDVTHRLKFVRVPEGEKKDWKGFFAAIPDDPIRKDVEDMLRGYREKGHQIIFISGRPEDYRKETVEWLLSNYGPEYVTLIMRKSGDKRPDTEVKQEIYDRYLKHYEVEVVIDDRPSVIQMWRENGLNVIDVGPGPDKDF